MIIVFVCTGNSCRSQMAEGLANSIMGSNFIIKSCGFIPEKINRYAIDVMSEIGVDISHQESSMIDKSMIDMADMVVTLCGDAQGRCLSMIESKTHIHWPINDPAKFEGQEDEIRIEFRSARDQIRSNINKLKETIRDKE